MLVALILVHTVHVAEAARVVSNGAFIDGATPLIERALTEANELYGTAFAVLPNTWAVKPAPYKRNAFDLDAFHRARRAGRCREVGVVVDAATGARARFWVRLSHPPRPEAPRWPGPGQFELVTDCRSNAPAAALVIDGRPTTRLFRAPEFASVATPLVRTFLRANGHADDFDPSTLDVRKSGVDRDHGLMRRMYRRLAGRTRAMDDRDDDDDDDRGSYSWTYRQLFGRNLACRRIRVRLPGENVLFTTYVSAWYRTDERATYLPADLQTIVHDPATLRPYRFALVNGCDRFGLFEPPTMRLITLPPQPR